MRLDLLLPLICAFLAYLKSLELIYVFQIKEYRFDRMRVYLKEQGLIKSLYVLRPRLAAKSQRNGLIAALNTLGFVTLFGFYFFFLPGTVVYLPVLLATPLVALVLTSVSVYLTGILAGFKRRGIVREALRRRARSHAVFIGITGSYGKTSTKEFLYHILSRRFKVAKTDANMNTDTGVALSILKNLKRDTQYFIAEAGAYRTGEIRKIAKLIRPRIAVLTAIGNQHMALFGSRRALIAAKKELLDELSADGFAYIHRDIPEFDDIIERSSYTVRSFSTKRQADIRATLITPYSKGIRALVAYGDKILKLDLPLQGAHHIHNLLPALGIALDLGVSKQDILHAVSTLKPLPDKLSTTKSTQRGFTILHDAYNSSVEGFLAAISLMQSMNGYMRRVIVSQGILELGPEKEKSYKRITSNLDGIELLTTDPVFKTVAGRASVSVYPDLRLLLEELKEKLDSKTLLLIEGKFPQNFIQAVTKDL